VGGASDNTVKMETSMTDQEKGPENGVDTQTITAEDKTNGRSELTALSLTTEKNDNTGAIQISPAGSFRVAENFSAAGLRPIAASSMQIYGTILNNRPIMASNLRVIDSVTLADHRPIFASELMVREDLTLPGGRPVFASDPKLLEASLLPGGRPIASNEIDDSETLMGYID
jgi:hypothetical protein